MKRRSATPELRMLTMRNPWAWATIYAGRGTDNRALGWQRISYRGLVAIHVARAPDVRLRGCVAAGNGHADWVGPTWPPRVERRPASVLRHAIRAVDDERSVGALGAYGFVIGVAELVDIHHVTRPTCCAPWGDGAPSVTSRAAWPVHLSLVNARPVWPPFEAVGALGLRVPTAEVRAAVLEAA